MWTCRTSPSFVLSDAVLNIAPTLAAKRDIVENAIALAQAVGMVSPQVAVLAAVEGVTAALPATADAASLAKMAGQGLINGAVVEGPLTVDAALSATAARANGIDSKMAGLADVLIVPGLESGAMMLQRSPPCSAHSQRGSCWEPGFPSFFRAAATPWKFAWPRAYWRHSLRMRPRRARRRSPLRPSSAASASRPDSSAVRLVSSRLAPRPH